MGRPCPGLSWRNPWWKQVPWAHPEPLTRASPSGGETCVRARACQALVRRPYCRDPAGRARDPSVPPEAQGWVVWRGGYKIRNLPVSRSEGPALLGEVPPPGPAGGGACASAQCAHVPAEEDRPSSPSLGSEASPRLC